MPKYPRRVKVCTSPVQKRLMNNQEEKSRQETKVKDLDLLGGKSRNMMTLGSSMETSQKYKRGWGQ